jgi:hypothetical protein
VDVARGERPLYTYQKGSPFNAALLFGIHITVIGRVAAEPAKEDDVAIINLSRGSSQVWTLPFQSNYYSAWDKKGPESIRVVVAEDKIVGALLMGNQQLADPLRQLIEAEADITPYKDAFLQGGQLLPQVVQQAWQEWRSSLVTTHVIT